MNPGAVVLSRSGVPVIADFANATGTPIVIDTDTGNAYALINETPTLLGVTAFISSIFAYLTAAQIADVQAGTALLDLSTAIQAVINTLQAGVGGKLRFPPGRYNFGSTGLITYPNIILDGESQAYTSSTRGVEFLYSGAGTAIAGTNILNGGLENISIDATNSTGTSVRGIYLSGCWLTDLKGVRVKGVTPAKGYGILIDTNSGFGAQHNYLEKCECSDGIIRFAGSGSSDQVTTTEVNVCRGTQYETSHASIIYIDATAEKSGTIATGFAFQNSGTSLMVGCDIEGAYTTGISQSSTHSIREVATVWDGFTGTNRVSGTLGPITAYNAAMVIKNIGQTVAAMPTFTWADNNASYVSLIPNANNVTGGAQDGNMVLQRNKAGTGLQNQFEWLDQWKLQHSKSIANVATTFLTLTPDSGAGFNVKVTAYGTQTAAGRFCAVRECAAITDSGAIQQTSEAAISTAAGGAAPVITFTPSGNTLLCQFNHGSATPTTIQFIITIDGPCTYAKN